MAVDGAATACYGSTAAATLRVPSLATVVVLPAARVALDECRLVGTVASDLNTLAGVRGARWAPPCKHEDEKIKLPPLEDTTSGGALAYLRVEKPRFLFPGGSAGVVTAADIATAAPPVAYAVRAGTFAVCAASGVVSSAASVALGEGRMLPPLGESSSPIALLLLHFRRRVLRSRQGGESQLVA
jgi:hypothetical protein